MTRFSLALAAVAVATFPAAVQAKSAEQVFEHAGVHYVYTATETNGRTLIRGYVEKGMAPFELTVRNGRVSGTVDGRAVSFRVADVKSTEVAAR